MNKIYIGIDNGATGTIGIIFPSGVSLFEKMKVKKEQNYTKKKQNISRIDHEALFLFFSEILEKNENVFALVERPMTNLVRLKNTILAARSLEAVLIVLERLQIPFQYIDSKEWQKFFFILSKEKQDLKKLSCDISCRLFPKLAEKIKKHKDGDSLLMAEYAKRKGL